MEQQLAHIVNEKHITKESLQEIHKEQILNNGNNKVNTMEIVGIFGGIDQVITTYLESKDVMLSFDQIQRLHGVLTTPIKIIEYQQNKLTRIEKDDENINESGDEKQITYTFDISDSYLHHLCQEKTNSNITKIIYSNLTMILVAITPIIWFVLGMIVGRSIYYYVYSIVMWSAIQIPWLILNILSFNKVAFKLVIRSFDFWIKTFYAMFLTLTIFIYANHLYGNTLQRIYDITAVIVTVLIIIFIASFDALYRLKKKWKSGLTVLFAIWFSWNSVKYQFIAATADDYVLHIKLTNSSISSHSLIASSSRILAIFMWKQAINAFRKKGKAISITISPYIGWKNDDKRLT
eukprot:471618_1